MILHNPYSFCTVFAWLLVMPQFNLQPELEYFYCQRYVFWYEILTELPEQQGYHKV